MFTQQPSDSTPLLLAHLHATLDELQWHCACHDDHGRSSANKTLFDGLGPAAGHVLKDAVRFLIRKEAEARADHVTDEGRLQARIQPPHTILLHCLPRRLHAIDSLADQPSQNYPDIQALPRALHTVL